MWSRFILSLFIVSLLTVFAGCEKMGGEKGEGTGEQTEQTGEKPAEGGTPGGTSQ